MQKNPTSSHTNNLFNQHELPEHERHRCEVWTLVMGYHRPVSEFNAGKQSEHQERTHFREDLHPGAAR